MNIGPGTQYLIKNPDTQNNKKSALNRFLDFIGANEDPYTYIYQGDDKGFAALLAQNPNLIHNTSLMEHEGGVTLLHMAAANGRINMIKLLHALELTNDETDFLGNIPLHSFIHSDLKVDKKTCLELIELLCEGPMATLKNGNQCKLIDFPNFRQITPLMKAAQLGKELEALCLLEKGANPNIPDETGVLPIHYAATTKLSWGVKLIATDPTSVNATNSFNVTPLHFACRVDNQPLFKALVENGANINATSTKGKTPLHETVQAESYVLAKKLMKMGAQIDIEAIIDENKVTPLQFALYKIQNKKETKPGVCKDIIELFTQTHLENATKSKI